MNKKFIKTIAGLTLGLGTIATIPAVVSSCGNKPITDGLISFGPGLEDETETSKQYTPINFIDPTTDLYSCEVELKNDLTNYTTILFAWTDGKEQVIPLKEDNVSFTSAGFNSTWFTDTTTGIINLKLIPTDTNNKTLTFTITYGALTPVTATLLVSFVA